MMESSAHKGPALRILHLEDSEIDHELACLALRRGALCFTIQRVETLSAFEAALLEAPDLVLADYQLPGFTALDAWQRLQQSPLNPRPPFILLSGAIGETAAVAAIQQGISDYLLKDNMGKLAHTVARSLEISHARLAKERADQELALSEQRLAELTAHLQASIELERAKIAREIHDDIGGALTAVKFDLAWLGRHSTDKATEEHIKSATEMLQHALGASQRIMLDLRPPILDQGLIAAVQWLVDGFSQRTGIPARLHTTQDTILAEPALQLVAYRTAQEALTNISKYAQCTRVDLDLSESEAILMLEIYDNGQGIRLEDQQKPHSFGLKGLKERARMAGGSLEISSPPGRGTSLRLSLPIGAGDGRDAEATP